MVNIAIDQINLEDHRPDGRPARALVHFTATNTETSFAAVVNIASPPESYDELVSAAHRLLAVLAGAVVAECNRRIGESP